MEQSRELKVYVSNNLFEALQRELGHCNCSMSGFVRTAILKEIMLRTNNRMGVKPSKARIAAEAPLEGQLVIPEEV